MDLGGTEHSMQGEQQRQQGGWALSVLPRGRAGDQWGHSALQLHVPITQGTDGPGKDFEFYSEHGGGRACGARGQLGGRASGDAMAPWAEGVAKEAERGWRLGVGRERVRRDSLTH